MQSKLPHIGTSIFTVMSQLAVQHNAINLGQAASFVIAPISMAGLTVMHCSFYATWKACFAEDEVALPI